MCLVVWQAKRSTMPAEVSASLLKHEKGMNELKKRISQEIIYRTVFVWNRATGFGLYCTQNVD